MLQAKTQSLPVLMHHYVSEFKDSVAVPPRVFEEQCRVMAEKGWRGVSLMEAEEFLLHGEPLPPKSCLITFDDGYLDNYLYALPLLQRYRHCGTLFVVTARLEAGTNPRMCCTDLLAGGHVDMPEIHQPVQRNAQGFLERQDIFCNQAEILEMEKSGVFALAGHSRAHLGVFTSGDFSGFCKPGDRLRTFYQTSYGTIWGLPLFPVGAGLAHRAFLPSVELLDIVQKIVPQDPAGALAFFSDSRNEAALASAVASVRHLGEYETDKARQERMWQEIAGGKGDLESLLGHPTRSLCWPWGKYSSEAWELAKEAGYQVFFTTAEGVNPPGQMNAVHRFKAKAKGAGWLLSRLWLYSRPWIGRAYSALRT